MTVTRILTNRAFPEALGSWECIEIDERGVMCWRAFEPANKHGDDKHDIECCFPIGIEDAREIFERCGRSFDESKLPANVVKNPYAAWM